MRYEYLLTFLKVVEKGSFIGSAGALNLSVGTVSFQVNKLEEFFGVKLLERSVRGVKLTKEGKIVHEKIRKILAELKEIKEEFAQSKAKPIRIALGNMPGVTIFPPMLREFKKQNPETQIYLEIKNSTECADLLLGGNVDVVMACHISKELDCEKYQIIKIGTDRLVLVSSNGRERKRKVTLEKALSLPLVTLGEGSGITKSLIQGLEEMGHSIKDLKVVVEVNSLYTQLQSVANGLGAAITSYMAAKNLGNSKLKILEIEDFRVERAIYLVYSKSLLEPKTLEFINFLTTKGREVIKSLAA